ncbi:class I tRNA ligase family protein [Patescibacteria group bacterium]|nr:class I tRNA ligase family protein [Patescibacteria group bacterium]
MFDPVDPRQSLPKMEEGILQYWKEEDIFKRSVAQRENSENFSFYDGPPFATGLPHYGHLLAGTIKDVIPRYQTMKGKRVERRFGWDCHGLPVENLIEKENKIAGHKEIQDMGIRKFNELCCSSVQRYTKEWRDIVERMGRWVDMDWDYKTMDPTYMESIWWVFGELHKKGLIYEGHKPMHVCPRCVTPLSNFEVTQGYKDVTDQSVTVKFLLKPNNEKTRKRANEKTYLLAWTTTPWTLPGNLFLAVDPKMKYVKVKTEDGEIVIFAKDVYEKSKDEHPDQEVIEELKGKDLIGIKYEPLFPYFKKEYEDKAYYILEGDFVTSEDGTGVVHIAPGFGEDDYNVLSNINDRISDSGRRWIPILQHVTMDGKFINEVSDFAGMEVRPTDDPGKTDKKIIDWLDKNGKLFSVEKYKHSYPHCWRCNSPLLNYATSSWFVSVEKIKEDLLDANAKTTWVPEHVRDGRFGKWLEGARDWAISRNRFWGTPIPIWKCEETGEIEVIGSRDDLIKHSPQRFTKLTVMRHAESEGNLVPVYQGKLPGTDLTDRGKKQVKEASKKFKSEQITTIYCSPLERTKQTAEILAKETGAQVVVDERLREVDFGEYEGKAVDFSDLSFVKARRAHKLAKDKPESIYHFPGMETWQQVQDRISDFLDETLPKHRSEHIIVVTHADPLQNVRHFFTQIDPIKISHQPYPTLAENHTFFWDHLTETELDLHKHTVDEVEWPNGGADAITEVTLVRHGQTDANKNKIIQGGVVDDPLNEKGKEQALETANKLKGKKFDVIISSTSKRAVETAEIIAKELEMKIDEKLNFLTERYQGDWGGKNRDDILKDNLPVTEKINIAMHHITAPNAESLSEFFDRGQKTYEYITDKYKSKKVLLVAHRGFVQSLMAFTNSLTYREAIDLQLKNTEMITFQVKPLFKRIPEVFDCWFESGSMPYAQPHHPFEQNARSGRSLSSAPDNPTGFPADFIAEGMDQTRGWFYTLMVLSTALFREPAFKNCVVNGIVLAEDGKKMSKSLNNYPDPMLLTEKYGADAVRFTLMNSPAVRGEDLKFSEKMVAEIMRNVLLPLWNAYSFFVTYAAAADFEPSDSRKESKNTLDIWIKAEMQDLTNRMTSQLDRYELSLACSELDETIDVLTNWYIRLSRRRFAGKGSAISPCPAPERSRTRCGASASDISAIEGYEKEDQTAALNTLHDVLLTMSQLLAPFCPFLSDAIYLNLVEEDHGSVHLTDWPKERKLSKEEEKLLKKTRLMRLIVSLGHKARAEKNIKVRQPLNKAIVALSPKMLESARLSDGDLSLIRQELNVKNLAFADDPKELAEVIVKVDARKIGPRLPEKVQDLIKAGKAGDFTLNEDGMILILEELLTQEEAQVVYLGKEGLDAAADRGVVVSVDTKITKELESEGLARDLIRTIQRLRKESGLSFTDQIALKIEGADEILKDHGDLIAEETRSELGDNDGVENSVEVGNLKMGIRFKKI